MSAPELAVLIVCWTTMDGSKPFKAVNNQAIPLQVGLLADQFGDNARLAARG